MSYQVLLADDHQLTLEGMKQILARDPAFHVAGEVNSLNDLHTKLQASQPDILMIDFENIRGFSLQYYRELLGEFPELKTLIVTDNHDRSQILKYLELGTPGFLTKDCSKDEILNAFQALAKGQKFYCNRVLDLLVESKFKKKNTDAAQNELNDREIQIINQIADGLSTQEMASKMCLSPHTINAYRKNILKKLGVKTPVEMIVKAYELHIIQVS